MPATASPSSPAGGSRSRSRRAPPITGPSTAGRRPSSPPGASREPRCVTPRPRRPIPPATPSRSPASATTVPAVDPSTVVAADTASWDGTAGQPTFGLAAAVDPGGLRREVFGFLPYWELVDSSTRLDWEKLSTVAYFGVGADGTGNLQKRDPDGSSTVGWSGWTSSRMTTVINAAHRSGARVVLTVQSFAWTSNQLARQKSLLGSADLPQPARSPDRAGGARPRRRRREPRLRADRLRAIRTSSPRSSASVRTQLNRVHKGYQLTFDTTGWIGNYPIQDATARGAADAVVIMGYDYRTAGSSPVGSLAPIGGPAYDVGRHGRRVPRPRPGLQGDPRRAVLRPGLVDRDREPAREEHLGHEVRRVGRHPVRDGARVRQGVRAQVRPGRGRLVARLPAPELHHRLRLRDAVAPALLRRRDRAQGEVRPRQPGRPARRRHLGARLRRDASRAVRGAQGQVHHRQGPTDGDRHAALRTGLLAGRRPAAGHGHRERLGHRADPLGVRRRAAERLEGREGDPQRQPAGAGRDVHLERGRDGRRRSSATGATGSPSGPRTPRTTARRASFDVLVDTRHPPWSPRWSRRASSRRTATARTTS